MAKLTTTRQLLTSRRFYSNQIRIVEVGPRDGLQNEQQLISTQSKIDLINRLSKTGLKTIETTSFVSRKWIPQFHDSIEVFRQIQKSNDISYPVFIPNLKGLQTAIQEEVKEIALFTTVSNTFSLKNINCKIEENQKHLKEICQLSKKNRLRIRGYISCVIGCPYEGRMLPENVAKSVEFLLENQCDEISLGDTIGVGTTDSFKELFREVLHVATPERLAIHCHDTYGQALVNICTAIEQGVRIVDSSIAGLGGCPYAKGATGNVATEDLVYMLEGMGLRTGVDLNEACAIGKFICDILEKKTNSRVAKALGY